MPRRWALALASALTAFVALMAVGLILYTVRSTEADRGGVPARDASPGALRASPPVDLEALIQEREGAYRQRLEEANARLREANRRAEELRRTLQALQGQATLVPRSESASTASSTRGPALTPEEAASIAQAAVGGGPVYKVELESERGSVGYEVKVGAYKVVVDAYTGEVLAAKGSGPAWEGARDRGRPQTFALREDEDEHEDEDD